MRKGTAPIVSAVATVFMTALAVLSTSSVLASPSAGRAGLGVYKGAGCDGVKGVETFERWLGRPPTQTLEFISWQVLSAGTTWGVGCWKGSGQKTVVYALPMLPSDNSASLADGAAGKFDKLFKNYATKLVAAGYGGTTIRIGWEFNGEWFPWAASKDPQSYIAYWRRIVKTMRSVPGAKFRFDWCTAGGWTNFLPEAAYPGDEYVDIIGMDFYNVSIDPKATTPQQRWESRMSTRRGLKWQRDFATEHGKPISFPEWGTGLKPDGGGGGDDPYFIEQMAAWIDASNVAYHNYWDHTGGVNAKLSDNHQPQAGAAFIKAFGGTAPKAPVMQSPD